MNLDWITPQFVQWLIGTLVIAGSVYGGIRSDLRNMRREIDEARDTAKEAHKRIDTLLFK